MNSLLANKIALVTGAASGIGRATALSFACAGAQVVVSDISKEGGAQTVSDIHAEGNEAIFVSCDVTQTDEVEALIQTIVEKYGQLDCAFNNAGIAGQIALTADCSEENWDRTLSVNLKGVWLCLKYELRQMLIQKSGAIVNMASVAAQVAERGLPAYAAAKGGVVALTRTAALEYAPVGIRINAICPAGVATPMTEETMDDIIAIMATRPGTKPSPMLRLMTKLSNLRPVRAAMLGMIHPLGRIGQPEDVAEAVIWLCSDAASFITGQALTIDGGHSIA